MHGVSVSTMDNKNLASQTSGRTGPRRELDGEMERKKERRNCEERSREATLNLVLHVSTAQPQPQQQPAGATAAMRVLQ